MKKIAILLVVALVTGVTLFADEAVVIDFAKLIADFPSDNPANNQATLTDYSSAAGSGFTAADKVLMKTSLAIENWEVVLNSSANTVMNTRNSRALPAKVKDTAQKFANETILGIRVHFPIEQINSFATVKPPFQIPAYADKTTVGTDGMLTVAAEDAGDGEKFIGGLGVVKNVGVIKSISANVFGNRFPHGLSVVFRDESNRSSEYFLGYLSFDGWNTMTWNNPNYIADVRNRELRNFPLYPQSAPYVAFEGFRIYKNSAMTGGDFVTYIKDVSIIYDKAVVTFERDIDDEGTWGILQEREAARRNAELQRLGQLQIMRFLETRKMDDPATRTGAAAATTTN